MRILIRYLALVFSLVACDSYIKVSRLPNKNVATSTPTPQPTLGLNLSLSSETTRTVLPGITSSWNTIDSDTMTASADWVLQSGDSSRNNGNYHYVSTYGVLRTLSLS